MRGLNAFHSKVGTWPSARSKRLEWVFQPKKSSNQSGFPTNSVFNHARMGDSRPGRSPPRNAAYCHIGFEGRGPIPISSLRRDRRARPSVDSRREVGAESLGAAISKYETSPAPRIRSGPRAAFWPEPACRKNGPLLHADATGLRRNREISQVGSYCQFSKEREGLPKSCVACSIERACGPRCAGARLRRRSRPRCLPASRHLRRRGS